MGEEPSRAYFSTLQGFPFIPTLNRGTRLSLAEPPGFQERQATISAGGGIEL